MGQIAITQTSTQITARLDSIEIGCKKVGIPIYFPDTANFQMQDDVMIKRLRTTGYAGDKLSEKVLKLLEHSIS